MGLEDIIPCEMSDKKTNTVCYHLYVESKKYNELVNMTKKTRLFEGLKEVRCVEV